MRIRLIVPLFLAMLAMRAPVGAAQDHQHDLGTVTFPVTCNAEAQARMSRGVAMLHSFWFTEARPVFESVAAADPACGIAYWGVAMTYFGNPMAGGTAAASQGPGWAAAQKAQQVGAKSDRDRGYVDAAVALFRDYATVDNRTRMRAYEAALARIVDRNPRDTESMIFYQLMVVANAPPLDLTFSNQKKAAETLIALYKEQPNHPGLAHYIIHAFDSPPLANLALPAARQYAGIAPAAPHAQHMPSHIFTRLGLWDESIASNRHSADLEPTPAAKSHASDYMTYAYLQQGRDAQALQVITDLGGTLTGTFRGGAINTYNGLAMAARYALERDDWKGAAALVPATAPYAAELVNHFARGIGAARSGDVATAREAEAALARDVTLSTTANDSYWATLITAQRLAVGAWIAHAQGNHAEAETLAREAAAREETVEKPPVTPGPLLPARELLGDLLMLHGKPALALEAYEATLVREPNRARTLTGAARAAKAAGKPDVARKYYTALANLMDPASPRPELREARTFLGR